MWTDCKKAAPYVCHMGQEHLSELVPSQWGSVHLFDMCLWFGHVNTALALAQHGVKGCKLDDHHLGALLGASDAPPPEYGYCCEGWETCSRCCWGFPVDNCVWMKDWEAPLKDAVDAAQRAAKSPLVSGILEIFSKDEVLNLAMSDWVAARLLDIAILCGAAQAGVNLSKRCPARPLRRWRGGEVWSREHVLSAALLAGAEFQDLHVQCCCDEVPLLLLAALDFDSEQWQQLGHFFSSRPWWPNSDLSLDSLHLFLSDENDEAHCWIDIEKVENGLRAGWNLKHIWSPLCDDQGVDRTIAGLLDLAILCGEPECADALVSAGVQLRGDFGPVLSRLYNGETLGLCCRGDGLSTTGQCKSAASAAAVAALKRSVKSEGAKKGVAVYQVLNKKFHPRGFDKALVHNILGLCMEAPKIFDQLDLWDEVNVFWRALEQKNPATLSLGR